MRKRLLLFSATGIVLLGIFLALPTKHAEIEGEEEEFEEYENLQDRYAQEFEQLRDPALNVVPNNRLLDANQYTLTLKRNAEASRVAGLNWQERGPIYDVVGQSNSNKRGGAGGYTAGIVQTALVDLASDPSGNVVLVGSPSGGLWRCTNFASTSPPNWVPVNDFMANLAVASICQDPSSPNIMYLATGDGNTRDVRGYGVWKSTNYGVNWTLLPSTTTYNSSFKILCDNVGNVYLATAGGGLKRSTNGGSSWTTISPTGLTAINPSYVPDLEISSTGRLHATFGYQGSKAQHAYTDNPATAISSSGWTISSGIRRSSTNCTRIEIATQGNILYAVTANSSYNVDSCYKSIDGGANWTLQNPSAAYPTGVGSGQTWYAITLAINPNNPDEFIVGGLDAYKSLNEGLSVSRLTYWVTTAPYVHADHHYMQWYKVGNSSRILVGCDGGITQSTDGGFTWTDRNQNLGIKQFYSCAINPNAGVNFLFAGAQDNGCHQITNSGLTFSTETTGGDGAYVHINQKDPQIQFGSYIYNQYRRSTNGGTTWSSLNLSTSQGYFINPFDYDDEKNIMYASNAASGGNNQIRRWENANTNTSSGSSVLTVDELTRKSVNSNASAFKVSPYTADRVYIGSNTGKLLRLDNASTVLSSTDITANIRDVGDTSFPTGYINCVNTGTSDNTLVAVFTNYGVKNVWYSNDGGTSWTAIDGTTGAGGLPDMPVWWAVFEPGSNTKLILGTEAGIYTTDAVNGANTVWTPDPNFPIVRTKMLKIRQSDNTLVAATYGRGLWTTTLGGACKTPAINIQPQNVVTCSGSNAIFTINASGTDLTYQWRKGGVNISGANGSSYIIPNISAADAGNFDVVITSACGNLTSTAATLSVTTGTSITSQPAAQSVCAGTAANFSVTATGPGTITYQWQKDGTNVLGATQSTFQIPSTTVADAGNYTVVVSSSCGSTTSSAGVLTVNTNGGCVTAVPIVDPDVTALTMLPNQVQQNTVLRIRVQRAMNVQWNVVDGQGRVVMRFAQKLTAGQTDLPLRLGQLSAGTYYLNGTTERGKLGMLKFQKL